MLWLLLSFVTGVTGFYFGFGKGAQTLGAISAQSIVGDQLSTINSSITDLTRNDLAYSHKHQEAELQAALFQLGSVYPGLSYWSCSDRDRQTIQAAKKYLVANPNIGNEAFGPEITKLQAPAVNKALLFCQDTSIYK